MNNENKHNISRRTFIETSAKTLTGLPLLSALPMTGLSKSQPSEKLNIAGIGIGGIGEVNLKNMSTENIVALCDVDWKFSEKVFQQYPDAKRYKDYRIMFDEMDQSIDAVMIATPDHTHAVIASEAMKRGKHVFLQKPMAHSISEVRELVRLARETQVATQTGNQANSSEGIRTACELVWDGAIGMVTEVDVWTDRPHWYQGVGRPTGSPAIPDTFDWDLFIGPAKMRPYNPVYTPYRWRGWWDFGTGVLGDMAGHVLDLPFWALQLGIPKSVHAATSKFSTECYPSSSIVYFEFPMRKVTGGTRLPAVKLNWYDGGLLPSFPQDLTEGQKMGIKQGGVLLKGTKGTLMTDCFGCNPVLLPETLNNSYLPPKKIIRRVENALGGGHEQDWIRACKEDPASRIECSSNFIAAAPYTEAALLGNIAIRLQGLNKRLNWDKKTMSFSNISPEEEVQIDNIDFLMAYNGYPHIEKHQEHFNAKALASVMISPTYRDGWTL